MAGGGQVQAGTLVRRLVAGLELLLAVVLSVAVVIASFKILSEVGKLLHAETFDKEAFLHTLDYALLTILAIDVIRTLIVAFIQRALPVRIVVETAMLAILREFISIEIRHPTNTFLLTLTAVFAVLLAAWIAMGLYEQGALTLQRRRPRGEGQPPASQGS